MLSFQTVPNNGTTFPSRIFVHPNVYLVGTLEKSFSFILKIIPGVGKNFLEVD